MIMRPLCTSCLELAEKFFAVQTIHLGFWDPRILWDSNFVLGKRNTLEYNYNISGKNNFVGKSNVSISTANTARKQRIVGEEEEEEEETGVGYHGKIDCGDDDKDDDDEDDDSNDDSNDDDNDVDNGICNGARYTDIALTES